MSSEKSVKLETVFDDRNDKTGPFKEQTTQGSKSKTGSKERVRWRACGRRRQCRYVPKPAPLPNKPWEPQFKLKLNPPDYIKMSWVRGVSVYSEMTIQNTQSTPTCYKMKCTDNSQFRVRPPMNFIDQGGSASVKIIHNSFVLPEPNKHYFAIYHVKCTPEDMRARNFKRVWKSSAAMDGVIRIPIAFETADLKISTNSTKQKPGSSAPPTSSTMTKTVSAPLKQSKTPTGKSSGKKK
ncbi:hypothetical protein PRIPAC_79362 [Pristionchus pacificus]|uniref:Major sperm protein n=1 Tax=Pristionchus pacificus TaxID=54126 RepID=A0A2A6BWL3_PRIPA|nr:hypothetical protein PRIPAC_79362 [Pristionchus pacificus]|eukprot:PDM70247.1 MSP domain-containing protein [Pristionchus pacificus]